MKKTAIALAAIVAASSSAMAAEFTVFGKVDMGLAYSNVDLHSVGTSETFSMDSGNNSGSRFGFKGTEDLGNGYAVSFHLENGFSADTGALPDGGRLFHREARLTLETPYAEVSFGRMGALTAGAGTYDIFQAYGDALDGGWAYTVDINNWADRSRYDNMVTIATQKFAGFKGYAQYSFGTDSTDKLDDNVTNERATQRYVGVGATYDLGQLSASFFYDSVLRQHTTDSSPNDAHSLSLSVAYDFEVAKVLFGAQYGWDENINFFTASSDDIAADAKGLKADGYRLGLSSIVPLPCGTLKAGVYYGDVETDDDIKGKNFNITVGHEYPWSKRTFSYIGLGYKNAKVEDKAGKTIEEENSFTAMLGLVHSF
ncbi:MAG: porin [Sutterellaceae bacterium]|nr:porin [Sutterellaceae bacterium]